jgi:heptose I phosphotransferase
MIGPLWQRCVKGSVRLRFRPDWPEFAGGGWLERIMSVAVTDRFHAKQGRSTGRWILQAEGRRLSVYLKRHYALPWWQGLFATLWPGRGWSPALQEWDNLEWARRKNLSVPESVAAGEFIGPWGRLQSFLAVEELSGMLPVHEAIPAAAATLDAVTLARWKRGLSAEIARLVRELHGCRRFHKDLYLCHFYIPQCATAALPPAWRGRVYLIDLHRLACHPWTASLWQVKDLAQLLYSSEIAGVTARDRLCFWKAYTGSRPHRWLRRAILGKWRRYRRHNQSRSRLLSAPDADSGTASNAA